MKTQQLRILGRHNHENAMAAIAMAYVAGVSAEEICRSVCNFQDVEHRIEVVEEIDCVAYYNDSTREKIQEAANRLGFHDCILAENLEEAVKICAKKANPGDAVLLSPACASWGQFDNYEQRGNMFKEYVHSL